MHISRWATIAAAAVMLAAGCGSPQATSPTSQAPTVPSPASSQPADQAGHNDADIAFAQRMIPHHAQAIEMAAMATTHATSPEVRELADNIKQAQQPEIDQMTGWLQTWGGRSPIDQPERHGRHGPRHRWLDARDDVA